MSTDLQQTPQPEQQPPAPDPAAQQGDSNGDAAAAQAKPPELLWHQEVNPSGAETIVLLHGVLYSHLEYARVIPHLSDTYHVLAVDLPGHSRSRSFASTAEEVHVTRSAPHVAALIRAKAHGGKAHVVGLSMGGFVALEVARLFPEVCRTVFVTGAAPFENRNYLFASRPRLIFAFMKLWIAWLPDAAYWWIAKRRGFERHEEQLREMRANMKWPIVRGVYASLIDVGWEHIKELGGKLGGKVRLLTVASGKEDDVECTKRMGEELRKAGGEGCKAVVVRSVHHVWDLENPELFARGLRAWIEGNALPAELEEL